MDLLESLNIPSLPEQQTKTDHKCIVAALEKDSSIRLGFDVCLTCAAPLPKKAYICKGCKRVSYCSSKCRTSDQAHGHGPIVCNLLKLCNIDEDCEEGLLSAVEGTDGVEDARYRVRTELESYPATLANVLTDSPLYRKVLSKKRNKMVTLHIIGASTDAELWKGKNDGGYAAYTEALTAMAEDYSLSQINLVFIGIDCKPILKEKYIVLDEGKTSCRILFEGLVGNYENVVAKSRSRRSEADIYIMFNPGLTCPDYSWKKVFDSLRSGKPFLISTNTELEAVMDCQWLYDQRLVASVPEAVVEMVRAESENTGNDKSHIYSKCLPDKDSGMFFGENPYSGLRIRQSGNFANDLFVKSKYILGGKVDKSSSSSTTHIGEKRKSIDSDQDQEKKKKKSNSALI